MASVPAAGASTARAPIWSSTDTATADPVCDPPRIPDGLLYSGGMCFLPVADGNGFALKGYYNATTKGHQAGQLAWSIPLPQIVGLSQVVAVGGRTMIFATTYYGFLYGIVLYDLEDPSISGVVDVRRPFCAADLVLTPPVLQLYSRSNAEFQSAIDAVEGHLGDSLVYVSTADGCGDTTEGRVLAFYASNLSKRWTFNNAFAYDVGPAMAPCALDYATNSLFCGNDAPLNGATTLYAIPTIGSGEGSVLWSAPLGPILVAPRIGYGGLRLYAVSDSSTLQSSEMSALTLVGDGQGGPDVIWTEALSYFVTHDPWVDSRPEGFDWIFLVDSGGRLNDITDDGTFATIHRTSQPSWLDDIEPATSAPVFLPGPGFIEVGVADGELFECPLLGFESSGTCSAATQPPRSGPVSRLVPDPSADGLPLDGVLVSGDNGLGLGFVDAYGVPLDPLYASFDAELTLTMTGPANVDVGTDPIDTISVTNSGPNWATSPAVNLSFPEGILDVTPSQGSVNGTVVTLGALAPGAAATIVVTGDGGQAGAYLNSASVASSEVDFDTADNTASVQTTVGPLLDHLALSPSEASVAAGDPQTYVADGVDGFGNDLGDMTADTTFTISPDGSCAGPVCTPMAVGPHTVTGTDGTAVGTASLDATARAVALALSEATSGQYSDLAQLGATLTDAETGAPIDEQQLTFSLDGSSDVETTDREGVAAADIAIAQAAGSTTASVAFDGDQLYAPGSASEDFTIEQEDAELRPSGATIGTTAQQATLRSTVLDSAAQGYAGVNPEPGGTIGDITTLGVAFDVSFGGCTKGGRFLTTVLARVNDTGTVGDGIGTATAPFTPPLSGSYCVTLRPVAKGGGQNLYYTAPQVTQAFTASPTSPQVLTGQGTVLDQDAQVATFKVAGAFAGGLPTGSLAYRYPTTYQEQAVIVTVTSNYLTGLAFDSATDPITATLEGGATIRIRRVSDGQLLLLDRKATFSATATDTGGAGSDTLSLTVYDVNGLVFYLLPATSLQSGDVVVS